MLVRKLSFLSQPASSQLPVDRHNDDIDKHCYSILIRAPLLSPIGASRRHGSATCVSMSLLREATPLVTLCINAGLQ